MAQPNDPLNVSNKNTIVLYIGAYIKAVNIFAITHLFQISKLAIIGTSFSGREISN